LRARSTTSRISRVWTTMNVENHFRQLKHNYLHHLLWPRLDQLVWILLTKVTPAYMQRASTVKDGHCLGHAKKLTTYQVKFKTA
ncbi:hypothetical protein SERLA73DRAFT_43998, partial [Serpula lacrymans var. lacrymans S7.3]